LGCLGGGFGSFFFVWVGWGLLSSADPSHSSWFFQPFDLLGSLASDEPLQSLLARPFFYGFSHPSYGIPGLFAPPLSFWSGVDRSCHPFLSFVLPESSFWLEFLGRVRSPVTLSCRRRKTLIFRFDPSSHRLAFPSSSEILCL